MKNCDDTCPTCGAPVAWGWEEAFDKFGFDDGDGLVMTFAVAAVLIKAGYEVTHHTWGMHNDVISELLRDGVSLIPEDANLGYDDPREYLPDEIFALLDRELPSNGGAL